jgi:rhodanese-related sulfurtransferase
MRKILLLIAVAALGFVLACADSGQKPNVAVNAPPKAADTHEAEHTDDAPRITLAEAKKDYDDGLAVFVDTRPAESFKQEHVKGAINLTAADLNSKADTLPKGKTIIAYCS